MNKKTFIVNHAGMMCLLRLLRSNKEVVRNLDISYCGPFWWIIKLNGSDDTTSATLLVEALEPFMVVGSDLYEEFTNHVNCYREEQLSELHENEDAGYRAQNPNAAEMYREQREREIAEALPTVAWAYLCKRFSLDPYAGEDQITDDRVRETVQALLWPYTTTTE